MPPGRQLRWAWWMTTEEVEEAKRKQKGKVHPEVKVEEEELRSQGLGPTHGLVGSWASGDGSSSGIGQS